MEKIKSYLDLGKKEGAKVLCGGEVAKLNSGLEKGNYIQPTIFEGDNKVVGMTSDYEAWILAASSGVGTIAAGVAKAEADIILISGHNGGTGATPQTSVKYVGIPWEMGLTEANQVLTLNNLRHKVTLRTDGGIKNGIRLVKSTGSIQCNSE